MADDQKDRELEAIAAIRSRLAPGLERLGYDIKINLIDNTLIIFRPKQK